MTYIVYDIETGSRNPHKTQITQIAAVALHENKLTIEPNGVFNSECKPILDNNAAIEMGYDPIEDGALEVTRKTREGLAAAPETRIVWNNFVNWVNRFNYKKSSYTAPIQCGYNINNFDSYIIQRYCEKYGPISNNNEQKLFNPIWKIDLMDMIYTWTEFNSNIKSRKLVDIMMWLGFPKEATADAHDALIDVKNTANILIKFLNFQREIASKTKFETAFAKGLYIE